MNKTGQKHFSNEGIKYGLILEVS